MNILITGGLGYVGGRLANYIKANSPQTNIFLTTRSKKKVLPEWAKRFGILEMDLADESSIAACLTSKNFDIIVHLAAMNEIESMENPILALEVNTMGTYRLLHSAQLNSVKKIIYFSTFHVYGDTQPVITEETPARPYHPYAITHRAAEDLINYYRRHYNMETLILRVSNGYGYPMDKGINRWSLVFNDLCRQIVNTGKIVLRTSGRQYRDFISMRDITRVVYHFIFIKPDEWGDGLYNVGGGCAISILEAAQKISEIYEARYNKGSAKIEVKSEPDDKAKPFTYSIDKLLKTHFYLEGDMENEILKTIEICEK